MGRDTHRVIGSSGQNQIFYPKPSLGGRNPSSPSGPNNRLRSSESAKIGAPHHVDPGAGGAAR
eukprot:4195458-Alexandrium_andersonii.AAC.1